MAREVKLVVAGFWEGGCSAFGLSRDIVGFIIQWLIFGLVLLPLMWVALSLMK
ncbi:hypothetical protein SPONN_1057 [uncultured Candidatus Thioglobus sp.]|nr:hypothetical protein SPONL_1996 [uncultured Candidatus Thioglobus sp.]SMN02426.1 hypothetical protein SPONN_1057 [uncultured Candidatus Thioglobus sp.]